jgi:carbon storage regulator
MLVLSRKRNEKIRIGKDVIVTVVEVIGDRVKIGITAPTDIEVVRGELSPKWKKRRGSNGLERPAS